MLALDPNRSRVVVHTFAEGLFARLAHDLELVVGDLSGTGSHDDGGGSASVRAPLSGFTVAGVLKGERVDASALSPSDSRDILEKMARDVFHAPRASAEVRVEATLANGDARVRVIPPSGRDVEVKARARVEESGDVVRATGAFDLSLGAIGAGVVKGPMGAFRVKDRVTVRFDLVFTQAERA